MKKPTVREQTERLTSLIESASQTADLRPLHLILTELKILSTRLDSIEAEESRKLGGYPGYN